MELETLTLKKKEFYSFSSQACKLYYKDTTISDVTIVCNDNKLLKAHKLILGSASQVMKNLITNTTGPSHVLKVDISSQNMELLLEYVYTGECEVESIHLSEFTKEVEYLHVNGLNLNNSRSMDNGKIVQKNPEQKSVFRSCHRETYFSDVTLMCQDNELIKAHKLILASSSKVLEDLIMNKKGQGHVIKLDISCQYLEILLELLYTGECKMKVNCLHLLQKEVEDLKVEGIYIIDKKLESEPSIYKTVAPLNTIRMVDIQANQTMQEVVNRNSNTSLKTIDSSRLEDGKNVKNESTLIDPSDYEKDTVDDVKQSKEEDMDIEPKDYVGKQSENVICWTKKDLTCPHCERKFGDNHMLKRHMNAFKGQGCRRVENPVICCTFCDFITLKITRAASQGSIRNHMIRFHWEKNIICQSVDCDFKANTKSAMNDHKQRVHDKENIITCELCGYLTHCKMYLRNHMKIKHEDHIYKCDSCEKQFRAYGARRAHMESAHLGIKYTCQVCGYVAQRKDVLKEHIQGEHEGKTFECNIQGCALKFKRKCYLNQHKRQHQLETC